MTHDTCCTIVPYFTVHDGRGDAFRAVAHRCTEAAAQEPGCLFYGFSYNGNQAHCREGYADAQATLAHAEAVGPLLQELLQCCTMTRFELHGPAEELEVLREPFGALKPEFFVLEQGFRR